MSLMNRASNLAMYELMGDAGLMNTELEKYLGITPREVHTLANKIFDERNSSTLFYYSNN